MTRCILIFALIAVLCLPTMTFAEAASEGGAPAGGETQGWDQFWDQFEDPKVDPASKPRPAPAPRVMADEPSDTAEPISAAVDPPSSPAVILDEPDAPKTTVSGILIGPLGVDERGRIGRLHTVIPGNTLWSLTAAYLGTPWIWPSVWIDNNDDIENPHLIYPGNKVWITANEMRVVTDEVGESYMASDEEIAAAMDSASLLAQDRSNEEMDVSGILEGAARLAALDTLDPDEPSRLSALPVVVPGAGRPRASIGRRITVVQRESMGFVSSDELDVASTIVASPVERFYLAAGDDVILGAGEGDVEIGDQFTIFMTVEEVRDPETHQLRGHHIEPLGWVEVKQLTGDTSIGEIRASRTEIPRGARVMRRQLLPLAVDAHTTPDAIEGKLMYLPSERTMMGDGGYVYINRGEFHGLETGSELEVYDSGSIVRDTARRVDVRTPDRVVAQLIVVSVQPDSAVAFVLSAVRELEVGDSFRPKIRSLAQR